MSWKPDHCSTSTRSVVTSTQRGWDAATAPAVGSDCIDAEPEAEMVEDDADDALVSEERVTTTPALDGGVASA